MAAERGTLYLVPNTLDAGSVPLPDIRTVLPSSTLEVAARLTHWLAENAKTTRAFLKRVDAVTPLAAALQRISIVELPRPPKGTAAAAAPDVDALLAPLRRGEDAGLISEAGLPAVADPGAAVVAAAHRAGLRVEPLAGPSALLLALAASGLEGQRFAFVGYVPQDPAERVLRLRQLEQRSRQERETQILIETPYRNASLLAALVATLQPTSRVSVSVGLTLPGGFTRSDTVAGWRAAPLEVPADRPAVFCLLAT
jgi:16S rRNA (cytidine1402-2'-O)-methyltransferase